ncbi:hypothetical protein [Streptomyces sp. NPDC055709]
MPRFAARHAADHTREDQQRIVLGPELPAGATAPGEHEVRALLRVAYPYLPADIEPDGPGALPSPPVVKARAIRRSSRPAIGARYGEVNSIERYNQLVVGRCSWIPDDDHPGSASAELEKMHVSWLKDWLLCLDVECGPRPGHTLRRLYGTVTSYDPALGQLTFTPVGGHPVIDVPVHRIIALTGDPHRRRTGEVPAHEPYDQDDTGP